MNRLTALAFSLACLFCSRVGRTTPGFQFIQHPFDYDTVTHHSTWTPTPYPKIGCKLPL